MWNIEFNLIYYVLKDNIKDYKNIINLKKWNFELFSNKTYINIIFYIKYLNRQVSIVIKKYVTHFKDHDIHEPDLVK